jgi:FkbM family methyltransferase
MSARAELSYARSAVVAFVRWPVFSRTSFRMVTSLARQGVAPRTIIDVGANKGQFTVAARNVFRPSVVHSFEPLPRVAEALRRNCARYPEVKVHQLALGAESGAATMHVNSHSQSSSLLPIGDRHLRSFPRAQEVGEARVEIRRLDGVLEVSELVEPVLMKIDAQGFEAPVLEGADGILGSVDMIVAETSFTPLYEGELPFFGLFEYLRQRDFDLLRPVGFLRDGATGEYLQMDALFRRGAAGSRADHSDPEVP